VVPPVFERAQKALGTQYEINTYICKLDSKRKNKTIMQTLTMQDLKIAMRGEWQG